MSSTKTPRRKEHYRWAWRNCLKRHWPGITPTRFKLPEPIRLNRSKHWPEAATYAEAREQRAA